MTRINTETMLLERVTTKHSGKTGNNKKVKLRNWWFVNNNSISLGDVIIPLKYMGKHVQFQMLIKEFPKKKEEKDDNSNE